MRLMDVLSTIFRYAQKVRKEEDSVVHLLAYAAACESGIHLEDLKTSYSELED